MATGLTIADTRGGSLGGAGGFSTPSARPAAPTGYGADAAMAIGNGTWRANGNYAPDTSRGAGPQLQGNAYGQDPRESAAIDAQMKVAQQQQADIMARSGTQQFNNALAFYNQMSAPQLAALTGQKGDLMAQMGALPGLFGEMDQSGLRNQLAALQNQGLTVDKGTLQAQLGLIDKNQGFNTQDALINAIRMSQDNTNQVRAAKSQRAAAGSMQTVGGRQQFQSLRDALQNQLAGASLGFQKTKAQLDQQVVETQAALKKLGIEMSANDLRAQLENAQSKGQNDWNKFMTLHGLQNDVLGLNSNIAGIGTTNAQQAMANQGQFPANFGVTNSKPAKTYSSGGVKRQ